LAIDVVSCPGLLAAIAKYKHGKNIVSNVLSTLSGVEWEAAVRQLSASPLKAPKVSRGGAYV
jgi:protoporphyrinogen oxidase